MPRHFLSFNYAASCRHCHGVGTLQQPAPEKLIVRPDLPLKTLHPAYFPAENAPECLGPLLLPENLERQDRNDETIAVDLRRLRAAPDEPGHSDQRDDDPHPGPGAGGRMRHGGYEPGIHPGDYTGMRLQVSSCRLPG